MISTGRVPLARRVVVFLLMAWASLAAGASPVAAAPADLDRSFGGNGIVSVQRPAGEPFSTEAQARMAIGPEDEIFVLYSTVGTCPSFSSCTIEWSLLRYDRDGNLDQGFGTGANSSLAVRQNPYSQADLAVGPDGKPVVVAIDEGSLVVARFDRAGHLDGSFAGSGRVTLPAYSVAGTPPVVAVQPDGKVVAGAEGGEGASPRGLVLGRYQADGNLDPGFGTGGIVSINLETQSRPAGLLLGAGGTITAGVSECCKGEGGEGPAVGFGRLLSSGGFDATFAGDGTSFFPASPPGMLRAIALAPDGSLYAALEGETYSGIVVKLAPTGAVDVRFGRDGSVSAAKRTGVITVSDLVVDAKNRLLGTGWNGSVATFRMDSAGRADRTFNGGQGVTTVIGASQEGGRAIALQSSGRIVVLGESLCCAKEVALFRLIGGTDHTRCQGRKATIVGTQGRDELTGTQRRDVIAALGGRDKVRALSGPDLICGGKGRDTLLGGPGRDQVRQ
jgi:uncharacterized delta-60 repeat protein